MNVLFSWDTATPCHRKTEMPRAEGLSHCLLKNSWEFSQHREERSSVETTSCSNEPGVRPIPLVTAGGITNDLPETSRGKLWKRIPDAFVLSTLYSPLFIVRQQILKLRSCSQSKKLCKKGECLLQEGIRVREGPSINRNLGMNFWGAPEIADILSLKCKRVEQKYIGFMGDLED